MTTTKQKNNTIVPDKSKVPVTEEIETSKSNSKNKKSSFASKVLTFFKLSGSKSDEDTAPDTPPPKSHGRVPVKKGVMEVASRGVINELKAMKKNELLAELIETEGITDEKQIKRLEKQIEDLIEYGDPEDDDYLDAFYDGEYAKEDEDDDGEEEYYDEEEDDPKDIGKNHRLEKLVKPTFVRSHSTKETPTHHFSIEEDGTTAESDKIPKLKKSVSSDDSSTIDAVKPKRKDSFIEIAFDQNKQWDKHDLESERLYTKGEEIPFDEQDFHKVYKTKSKKKGFKLFSKEVRFIAFKDGVMYVTKKMDDTTAVVRSIILLSRVTQVEIEEEKKLVCITSYNGDLTSDSIKKEYKCDDYDDFLDRLDWELEPLNSSVKLLTQ